MKSTRISIIRHGETEMNVSMQLQGHSDSPLTKRGIKQAELLAEGIKNRKFDVFYSSNLGRATTTANIINKHLKLDIRENKNLRERSFGVMEGLTREQVKIQYPELFHVYMHRNSDQPIQGGESLEEFSSRIVNEIDQIAESNLGENVLLVAHGGVLDCIIRKVFSIKLNAERSFTLLNSSINTITIKNKKWILEEWGNIEHLHNEIALNEGN